jgi:hypothetical protein
LPVCKNRPPISDDTPVWRYLSLSAVLATIKTRKLRLTRVDKFHDPFEGSVPKSQIDQQFLPLTGAASARVMMQAPPPDEEPWTKITRLRRARIRSAHASCWSIGEESEALWRLYCHDDGCQGVGVAFQTTLARLKASVAVYEPRVDPITYIRYHEAPPFTDEMAHLLHKRHGFAAENELRVLHFDQDHYNSLIPKDASVPELSERMFYEWHPSNVIEEIVISPYAGENYEDLVRTAITESDPTLTDRVVLSVLNERRNPAYF